MVNKKSEMARIKVMVLDETSGIGVILKKLYINSDDITALKATLVEKERLCRGKEKDIFKNLSLKLNENNYKNCIDFLDRYFKRKSKLVKIGNDKLNVDVKKNSLDNSVKDKSIETSIEKNLYLKEKLKKYFYKKEDTILTIFLRTKEEYAQHLTDIRGIKDIIEKGDIKVRIRLMCESRLKIDMSPTEKSEFVSFLKKY